MSTGNIEGLGQQDLSLPTEVVKEDLLSQELERSQKLHLYSAVAYNSKLGELALNDYKERLGLNLYSTPEELAKAVIAFQAENHLKVDGKIGHQTSSCLELSTVSRVEEAKKPVVLAYNGDTGNSSGPYGQTESLESISSKIDLILSGAVRDPISFFEYIGNLEDYKLLYDNFDTLTPEQLSQLKIAVKPYVENVLLVKGKTVNLGDNFILDKLPNYRFSVPGKGTFGAPDQSEEAVAELKIKISELTQNSAQSTIDSIETMKLSNIISVAISEPIDFFENVNNLSSFNYILNNFRSLAGNKELYHKFKEAVRLYVESVGPSYGINDKLDTYFSLSTVENGFSIIGLPNITAPSKSPQEVVALKIRILKLNQSLDSFKDMADRFKTDSPDNVNVGEVSKTEVRIRLNPDDVDRGVHIYFRRGIYTNFEEKLGEIKIRTDSKDPFTKIEWVNINSSGLNSNQKLTLEQNGFDIDAIGKVAKIESRNDKSLIIANSDGTSFATICKGGSVNIYNKENIAVDDDVVRKPVIYLYPKKTTDIQVSLKLSGAKLISEYPKLNNGKWNITATPKGNLTDKLTNKKYSYLFWEAKKEISFTLDLEKSFCVDSDKVEEFLEKSLKTFGLNIKESNDFIVYWLPILEQNPYSIIEFKTEEYTNMAELNISPKPDTLIRVFMVFKGSKTKLKVGSPKLKKVSRKGYSVIEWGGCNLYEGKYIK